MAVELVTAIRWIKNRGKGIEYSYKELVEFVCLRRGILNEKLHHFCYKLNIMSALEYVIKLRIVLLIGAQSPHLLVS